MAASETVVTDRSLDELGPVDYLVVEFPAGASNFTGEMAKELLALVDAGQLHRKRRLSLRTRRLTLGAGAQRRSAAFSSLTAWPWRRAGVPRA